MLKDVSMGGASEWMHVLCALTSPRVAVNSYQSLNFVVNSSPSKHINKQKKCMNCQTEKSEGLQCCIKDCKVYIHLSCVIDYYGAPSMAEQYGDNAIIGLLNKHEGSLLSYLVGNKAFKGFSGLSSIFKAKDVKKSNWFMLCDTHNSLGTFNWCPCEQSEDEDVEWI